MSSKTIERPNFPLFREYGITELAEKSPYAESYLVRIKEGNTPAGDRFRRVMAKILGRSEAELFGELAATGTERV